MMWEVKGIRQRGRPKKTWWDCVMDDMESLGLSQKDVQSRNKWRRRIKGQPANPGSPGKMAVKTNSVCVLLMLWLQRHRKQYSGNFFEPHSYDDVKQYRNHVSDIQWQTFTNEDLRTRQQQKWSDMLTQSSPHLQTAVIHTRPLAVYVMLRIFQSDHTYSLSLSLSLHFNGHFPGVSQCLLKQRMMEVVVVTTGLLEL